MINPKMLITGAKGFIGSHAAIYFKKLNYIIYGIGHGDISIEEAQTIGLDYWLKSDITIKALKDLNQNFDIILHLGGSGSVGFSVEYPYQDFNKTVNGTLEVLEYIRLYNSNAKFIYPSSPAVHGECLDVPIKEFFERKPVSPYGFHKKIVEDLCRSYSKKYNLNIKIIRLFSVYGVGLKKQLIWDSYNKFSQDKDIEFWGTGNETRDFIHVNDVLCIIKHLINDTEEFKIINGATGVKYTIKEIVEILSKLLNFKHNITFNNISHEGNPIYYWGDTSKLNKIVKMKFININEGLQEYTNWIKDL